MSTFSGEWGIVKHSISNHPAWPLSYHLCGCGFTSSLISTSQVSTECLLAGRSICLMRSQLGTGNQALRLDGADAWS